MSYLKINNLSKHFEQSEVLSDINLDIELGSFVTLLGPSGCGKTTLLRIIAGLEYPSHGSIYNNERCFVDVVEGVSLAPQHRQLGFVFQDYALWPHMSVFENVAFPLRMAKQSELVIKRRVLDVLDAVRLTEHANKKPEQLSGGQKQRVSIARALSAKPKLILFDEPLSNLDANLREELGQEIRSLANEFDLTCVNVTHDRREAQILSDKIAIMRDGVICQTGTADQIYRSPKDQWVAEFVDAGNILPAFKLGISDSTETILVPRTAFKISEEGDIDGQLLSAVFIGDRFELTVDLNGQTVHLYSLYRPEASAIKLEVNREAVYSF